MKRSRLLQLAGVITENHVDYENDDPVGRIADEFEKIVRFEMEQQGAEPEDSHEVASDVMNTLHKILRDRGLMG